MRHALKRDSSHKAVADALRAVGADVLEGFDCDLYVLFRGKAYLIEVKSPDQVSKRNGGARYSAIQPKQKRLKEIFSDQMLIVFTPEGALRAIGAVQELPESGEWSINHA